MVDDRAGCKRYLRTHGEIYHLFRLTMGKKNTCIGYQTGYQYANVFNSYQNNFSTSDFYAFVVSTPLNESKM